MPLHAFVLFGFLRYAASVFFYYFFCVAQKSMHAICLVSLPNQDIVTFNTLLSASRWEGMLAILLQMEQMRTPIEDVAALTVVDSCAQAGQLALGRHILENIFQHVTWIEEALRNRLAPL